MPKVYGTRKEKAEKLLKMVKSGPSLSPFEGLTPEQIKSVEEQYQRWANSWIVDDLIYLVPELRKKEGL